MDPSPHPTEVPTIGETRLEDCGIKVDVCVGISDKDPECVADIDASVEATAVTKLTRTRIRGTSISSPTLGTEFLLALGDPSSLHVTWFDPGTDRVLCDATMDDVLSESEDMAWREAFIAIDEYRGDANGTSREGPYFEEIPAGVDPPEGRPTACGDATCLPSGIVVDLCPGLPDDDGRCIASVNDVVAFTFVTKVNTDGVVYRYYVSTTIVVTQTIFLAPLPKTTETWMDDATSTLLWEVTENLVVDQLTFDSLKLLFASVEATDFADSITVRNVLADRAAAAETRVPVPDPIESCGDVTCFPSGAVVDLCPGIPDDATACTAQLLATMQADGATVGPDGWRVQGPLTSDVRWILVVTPFFDGTLTLVHTSDNSILWTTSLTELPDDDPIRDPDDVNDIVAWHRFFTGLRLFANLEDRGGDDLTTMIPGIFLSSTGRRRRLQFGNPCADDLLACAAGALQTAADDCLGEGGPFSVITCALQGGVQNKCPKAIVECSPFEISDPYGIIDKLICAGAVAQCIAALAGLGPACTTVILCGAAIAGAGGACLGAGVDCGLIEPNPILDCALDALGCIGSAGKLAQALTNPNRLGVVSGCGSFIDACFSPGGPFPIAEGFEKALLLLEGPDGEVQDPIIGGRTPGCCRDGTPTPAPGPGGPAPAPGGPGGPGGPIRYFRYSGSPRFRERVYRDPGIILPVHPAEVFGDPHLHGFDDAAFSCQVRGEVHYLVNSGPTSLNVQVRQRVCDPLFPGGSCATAVVAGESGSAVIQYDAESVNPLKVDGVPFSFSPASPNFAALRNVFINTYLDDETILVLRFASQAVVSIRIFPDLLVIPVINSAEIKFLSPSLDFILYFMTWSVSGVLEVVIILVETKIIFLNFLPFGFSDFLFQLISFFKIIKLT